MPIISLWQTEADLKLLIGKIGTFNDAERVRELIGRTATPMNLETRNTIEHSIDGDLGRMYTQLTGGNITSGFRTGLVWAWCLSAVPKRTPYDADSGRSSVRRAISLASSGKRINGADTRSFGGVAARGVTQ